MSKDVVKAARRTKCERLVTNRADREIANNKAREQPLSRIPLLLIRSRLPKPEFKHAFFSELMLFLPPVENRSKKD